MIDTTGSSKKRKLVVLGMIEDSSGNILLAQRYDPKIPRAHLKWDFPGGTNEFGESLEDTLVREVLEETGLKVTIKKLLPKCSSALWKHDDYELHSLVFCYSCRLVEGELNLKDHKINDLKWIRPSELKDYDFLPTTKEFIQEFSRTC